MFKAARVKICTADPFFVFNGGLKKAERVQKWGKLTPTFVSGKVGFQFLEAISKSDLFLKLKY